MTLKKVKDWENFFFFFQLINPGVKFYYNTMIIQCCFIFQMIPWKSQTCRLYCRRTFLRYSRHQTKKFIKLHPQQEKKLPPIPCLNIRDRRHHYHHHPLSHYITTLNFRTPVQQKYVRWMTSMCEFRKRRKETVRYWPDQQLFLLPRMNELDQGDKMNLHSLSLSPLQARAWLLQMFC